jgi:hypothetical protein
MAIFVVQQAISISHGVAILASGGDLPGLGSDFRRLVAIP